MFNPAFLQQAISDHGPANLSKHIQGMEFSEVPPDGLILNPFARSYHNGNVKCKISVGNHEL